jgi:hypothetical protein
VVGQRVIHHKLHKWGWGGEAGAVLECNKVHQASGRKMILGGYHLLSSVRITGWERSYNKTKN